MPSYKVVKKTSKAGRGSDSYMAELYKLHFPESLVDETKGKKINRSKTNLRRLIKITKKKKSSGKIQSLTFLL